MQSDQGGEEVELFSLLIEIVEPASQSYKTSPRVLSVFLCLSKI